jgi:glycosyltransferase involved in cell wall biosynthesis
MKQNSKNSLKRVVIIRNAYKWQYGGAEQYAYNLATGLEAQGIETTVVTRVPELIAHCRRANIRTFRNVWFNNETHRSWMPIYYLLMPLLIGQYVLLLRRTKADLLVVSSRDDQIFGTIAAKYTHTPVIWFDHADMKNIVRNKFRFLSKSYYWALKNADRVIMTSAAEHEKVSANLPESKQSNFVMINNGALKGSGKAMARPAGKKIVAYVGRLDRDKGIFDLVEAAAKVVRSVPEVEFWLGGKGPYEEELRKKITELRLTDSVKLLGHLDNVWDLLLAADLFVYPTHHDAAPLAPIEAVIAGVPVLASRIGGIPEMVPKSASVLLPAKDPDAWARELIRVLSHPDVLEAMRAGAKASGQSLEFATVLTESYLPLFRQVTGTRS